MKKTCVICKKDFETSNYNKKSCSPECKSQHIKLYYKKRNKCKPLENRTCELCGIKYNATSGVQKYCSSKCGIYRKILHYKLDKPKEYKIMMFKKELTEYFLKKYCELGDYIMRYDFFYSCYISFLKKYTISIRRNDLTRYLKEYTNIKTNSNTRASQRKLFGVRFNEKGMKWFGVENISNLALDKEITSLEACIEISCKQGRHEIITLYNSLETIIQDKIDLERLLINYKQIETFLYQRNQSHRTNIKMSVALYLTTGFTQEKCAKMCGSTANSLRVLFSQLPVGNNKYKNRNIYPEVD